MNIIVCIKQVPDTAEVRLDPVKGTLIRDGVPAIINPDDKAGIEAALTLREQCGGKVTVLSMGPAQADLALREALAMGADEGILLTDRAFGGADTWATSSTLAAALKKHGYDVIITGRQAIDGDTAQVGPQIAEHLQIPHVSYAEDIIVDDGKLIVRRAFEDRCHLIEVTPPCLITALSEMNRPRYMSVAGIYDAYRVKDVQRWTLAEIEAYIDTAQIGLQGSPTRVKASFTKQVKSAGTLYDNISVDEAVALIVEKLAERHII